MKQAEKCINTYANAQRMPQGAFDALSSITFNLGCGKLKNSTLFKMARQGYSKANVQPIFPLDLCQRQTAKRLN